MYPQWISRLSKTGTGTLDNLASLLHLHRFVPPQQRGIDPVAEAEIFLSYGERKEALRVLLYTVKHEPENLAAQLLLLQTYAYLLDSHAYIALAQSLEPRLAHLPIWQIIASEGRELAPRHPLFQAA